LSEAEQVATMTGISVIGRGHQSASSAADSVVYAGPQKYKLLRFTLGLHILLGFGSGILGFAD